MAATKEKLIIVPVKEYDIVNNVENIPRIPSEAGIIDIQWRRKMSMKNYFLEAKVDLKKIYLLLNTLKAMGNAYYRFWDPIDLYNERSIASRISDDPSESRENQTIGTT